MFKPNPLTNKYSWENKSKDVILNNPNLPKAPVVKGVSKKEVGNNWVKNVQAPDSFLENLLEIVDPTGYLSYDDAARADSTFKASGRKYPNTEEALNMFGVVPALGKFSRIRYAVPTRGGRVIPWQNMLNFQDGITDIVDENAENFRKLGGPLQTDPVLNFITQQQPRRFSKSKK